MSSSIESFDNPSYEIHLFKNIEEDSKKSTKEERGEYIPFDPASISEENISCENNEEDLKISKKEEGENVSLEAAAISVDNLNCKNNEEDLKISKKEEAENVSLEAAAISVDNLNCKESAEILDDDTAALMILKPQTLEVLDKEDVRSITTLNELPEKDLDKIFCKLTVGQKHELQKIMKTRSSQEELQTPIKGRTKHSNMPTNFAIEIERDGDRSPGFARLSPHFIPKLQLAPDDSPDLYTEIDASTIHNTGDSLAIRDSELRDALDFPSDPKTIYIEYDLEERYTAEPTRETATRKGYDYSITKGKDFKGLIDDKPRRAVSENQDGQTDEGSRPCCQCWYGPPMEGVPSESKWMNSTLFLVVCTLVLIGSGLAMAVAIIQIINKTNNT